MTSFSVEEIRIYAQKNPQTCQGKTDEEIVSIMVQDKNLQLNKDQEFSLFLKSGGGGLYPDGYTFQTSLKDNLYLISPDKPELEPNPQEEQAFNFLNGIFEKADTDFQQQLKTEGKVSHFVNFAREKANAENTRTDVDNALKDTKSDLRFLDASLHGKLVNGNDELIEFEDAFKTLRGVKYSQDKINTCQQKSQIYMQADMINSCFNELINNLEEFSKASTNLNNPKEFNKNMLKSFSNLGIKDYDDINNILEKFNEKNGSEYKLIELGTNDKEYYKQNFAIMHKNKDGRYLPLTPEQAQSLSEAMQTKLQDVKNIMLGLPPSATQEDCDNYVLQLKNDYKSAFKDAYGTKELTILSEEYINAQQKGVGYINMGVTVGAIALAVFTGGATATIATAVAMAQPMQILENATDSNGFTKQDWNEYEKMVAQQLPWMAVGMGMGKIGDMARSCVKLKGLQSVAQKTGQSLDDYINTVAKAGNLPDDVAKTLKSTRVLAETAGVSTEFALDVATTLAVYRDMKSEDWLMALAGALAGSKMNAKLAQMGTPNAKAQFLMDTFKELKLTPDEANKILKAMDKIVDETPDNVNKPSREQLKEQIASGKKINNESNSTPNFLTEIRSNAENLAEGDIIFADIKGYGKVEITKLADDKFTYKLVKKYSENQSEIVQPEKVYNANNKKEFINAINEILPDENLTKMLEGLSEQDNKILKNVFENIYKPYENHEYGYNDFIEFVNLLQTRCQEQNTKISDELQFIDKILKSPRDTDNLIDCPGAILIPQGNVEWNIAKRLFELKETCDNPLLNVDNIVYLSSSMKDISDIELLVKRFEEKNPDGTYKYGIDDFDNKYAIDKSLINNLKQEYMEKYADSPEIQKELEDFFIDCNDKDLTELKIRSRGCKPENFLKFLADKNPKTILNDISEGLELVTDDTIKKEIMAKTKDIELSEMTKQEKVKALIEQRQLVDTYNNLKGNYVTLDNKYWAEYLDFLAQHDPELHKTICGENQLEKKSILQKILNKESEEFKESQRVEQFVDYCKKHNDEVSQYMYEEVYLKDCDFAPEIKQRLVDINRQYGVKIFPNKNLGNDAERCLKYIERELTAWKIASNGTAKYPPVIDFTISKRAYIDDKSAYGQSTTAGFSESLANGAISLDGMTYQQVKYAFRHELMHSNDLKLLSHFEEGFVVKEDGKIVAQKCKFYDDFVKLGISKYHISYAYNNPKEFIAVAAESTKLNECSPEFKQTLIDFGMPEWMFDVKYDEDAWMLDFEL